MKNNEVSNTQSLSHTKTHILSNRYKCLKKIKFIRWKCAQTCSLINSFLVVFFTSGAELKETRLNAKKNKKI